MTRSIYALALLLAACGPDAAAPPAPSAPAPPIAEAPLPTPEAPPVVADGGEAVGAPQAPAAPAPPEIDPHVVRGDCSLVVDGRSYIDVKRTCPIYLYPDRGGAFMINSDGVSLPSGYFAQVEPAGDGTAAAYWNDAPGANHAQTPLGDDLRRDGGCWSNARVKICAIRR